MDIKLISTWQSQLSTNQRNGSKFQEEYEQLTNLCFDIKDDVQSLKQSNTSLLDQVSNMNETSTSFADELAQFKETLTSQVKHPSKTPDDLYEEAKTLLLKEIEKSVSRIKEAAKEGASPSSIKAALYGLGLTIAPSLALLKTYSSTMISR